MGLLSSWKRVSSRTWMAIALALLSLSVPGWAQNRPQTNETKSTQLLFLGTAGGPPLREDRSEPSTLLAVDGRSYLIDCGIGTMRRMLQAGVASHQIGTIFFTHLHSDHDLGLADVMANDFFRLSPVDTDHPVNIYGPPQTRELVDAAFHYVTISVRPFAAENPHGFRVVNGEFVNPFVTHEIEHEGVIFQDDRIRVIAAENTHYALMPADDRRQLKSYSYRFETPHGVIVFTGDTGPSDAVVKLAQGADVLIAEASTRDPEDLDRRVDAMSAQNHWPPARSKIFHDHLKFEHLDSNSIGALASKAKVKSVVVYHYNPVDKADYSAYLDGVRKFFPGPVFGPDDLDRYCLGTASSGGLTPCSNRSASH